MKLKYTFVAEIMPSKIGKGGAYVVFPYDLKKEFGVGRLKVKATFDGVFYAGSIVNMGLKDPAGNICYILGIKKDIQQKIAKTIGDSVTVTVKVRD